jgi:Family of unknown function (DUF6166)
MPCMGMLYNAHASSVGKAKSMKSFTTLYAGRLLDLTDVLGELEVTVDGQPLDPKPSQKLHNHSPDGFAWGYGGSGPAQLALAILLDFYGLDAEELRYYQDFKFAVIANLARDKAWMFDGMFIQDQMTSIIARVSVVKRA